MPALGNNNDAFYKRNDAKTSSLTRTFRKKPKADKLTTSRYTNYSNRHSGEFNAEPNKRELVLIGVNKHSHSETRAAAKTIAHSSSSPSSPVKDNTKFAFQSNAGMNYNFVSTNDRSGDIGLKSGTIGGSTSGTTGGTTSGTKANYKLTKILSDIGVSKQGSHNAYLTSMAGGTSSGLVHPLNNGLSQTGASFSPTGLDSNMNHRHSQMMHYSSQSHVK